MSLYALREPLLKRKVAAALLSVSPTTIDRLVRAGRLRSVKVGGSVRFVVSDLENYVMGQKGVSNE